MSALPRSGVEALVRFYGADVLSSFRIQSQQLFCQHGTVSVFDHSFAVACLGLYLVLILGLRVDRRALVRGACSMTSSSTTGMCVTPATASTASPIPSGHWPMPGGNFP